MFHIKAGDRREAGEWCRSCSPWTGGYPHCQTDFQQSGVGSRRRNEKMFSNFNGNGGRKALKNSYLRQYGSHLSRLSSSHKKALVISVIPMEVTNSFADEVNAWIKLSPTWCRAKVPTYLIKGQPRASSIHGQRTSSVLKRGAALVALKEHSATGCRYNCTLPTHSLCWGRRLIGFHWLSYHKAQEKASARV